MGDGTNRYGLLGRDIAYSLSPAMHNAAFKYFGMHAEYELFDCDDIDKFFQDKVETGKLSGFNVTVPYKIDAFKRVNVLNPEAKYLGTVNTVTVKNKQMIGDNTDGKGFYRSLKEDLAFDTSGKNIFIFGIGGAGRAIGKYLASEKMGESRPDSIYVYDTYEASVLSLINDKTEGVEHGIFVRVKENEIAKRMDESALLINATPLGTKEGDERSAIPLEGLKKGMAVYDLVYARETALIKAAEEKGLIAINGLGMLVNQAALAFEIWTGKPFDEVREVMKDAAIEEIARRES